MKKLIYLFAASIIISSTSCKKDPPENKKEDPINNFDLSIELSANFKGSNFDFDQWYITESSDTIKLLNLKYIFGSITLEKENGDLMTLPDPYAYFSLVDGNNKITFKNIPKGKYKSLRFKVGLDSAINHGNPSQWAANHPLNPAINNMHWGWQGGYIFNVFEGNYKNNGSNAGFTFHVALLKNARNYSFVENFEITKNGTLKLAVNVDKFLNNNIQVSLKNDGAFSHSALVDPLMDKFLTNAPGVLEFIEYKE